MQLAPNSIMIVSALAKHLPRNPGRSSEPSSDIYFREEGVLTLIALLVYVMLARSAYSMGLGMGFIAVGSSCKDLSSAKILSSTSGC